MDTATETEFSVVGVRLSGKGVIEYELNYESAIDISEADQWVTKAELSRRGFAHKISEYEQARERRGNSRKSPRLRRNRTKSPSKTSPETPEKVSPEEGEQDTPKIRKRRSSSTAKKKKKAGRPPSASPKPRGRSKSKPSSAAEKKSPDAQFTEYESVIKTTGFSKKTWLVIACVAFSMVSILTEVIKLNISRQTIQSGAASEYFRYSLITTVLPLLALLGYSIQTKGEYTILLGIETVLVGVSVAVTYSSQVSVLSKILEVIYFAFMLASLFVLREKMDWAFCLIHLGAFAGVSFGNNEGFSQSQCLLFHWAFVLFGTSIKLSFQPHKMRFILALVPSLLTFIFVLKVVFEEEIKNASSVRIFNMRNEEGRTEFLKIDSLFLLENCIRWAFALVLVLDERKE